MPPPTKHGWSPHVRATRNEQTIITHGRLENELLPSVTSGDGSRTKQPWRLWLCVQGQATKPFPGED
jgi:hypothetical protein